MYWGTVTAFKFTIIEKNKMYALNKPLGYSMVGENSMGTNCPLGQIILGDELSLGTNCPKGHIIWG
jgi:hypothetical protein